MRTIKNTLKSLSTVIGGYLFTIPGQANAATLTNTIQNVTNYLSGDLAKVVGGLIIVVAGYMCFAGNDLPKKRFFQIVVGLGLILGGSELYTTMVA